MPCGHSPANIRSDSQQFLNDDLVPGLEIGQRGNVLFGNHNDMNGPIWVGVMKSHYIIRLDHQLD